MLNSRNKIGISIFMLFLTWLTVWLLPAAFAESDDEEMSGRYNLIYDSTSILPSSKGGYDYTRKFISEVTLAQLGRSALSRPATPILGKEDEIKISAYTRLSSGEILKADTTDMITRDLPGDQKWIFVNFRQAEPGAVLHLEWVLNSTEANVAGKRFLGRTVPVDSAIVIITAPESWQFNFAINPGANALEKKTIFAPHGGPRRMNYRWVSTNLPALSGEEFAPPVERTIPCLYFSFFNDASLTGADSIVVDWKYLSRLYYGRIRNFTKLSGSLNPVADSIKRISVQAGARPIMAYDWLQRHFQSINTEISLSSNIDEALSRGRGSQAEAAAILFCLLEKLKIQTTPFLVATHDVGEPLRNLPALFWFDRLLINCQMGIDTVWIDPYYQNTDLGILPFEDQGANALKIGETGGEFSSIPLPDYHDNARAIHLELAFDSTGSIKGDATEIYSGAMIPEISSYLQSLEEGEGKALWEKNLSKSFPDIKIVSFVVIPPDSAGENYKIGYSFTTGPIIRPSAIRAYIPLDLLGRWADLPSLPEKNRQFPLELKRPRFELERITLDIAPPFEIDYLPDNYSENDYIGEIYSVIRGEKKIVTITRGFGLKKPSLPLSEYGSFRKFITRARIEADKHIVLKKAG
jgi:hypothetical protein